MTFFLKKRKKGKIFVFPLVLLVALLTLQTNASEDYSAQLIKIEGTISPATLEYVKKAFSYAEDKKMQFLIIQLDTPGGLDRSMREIVKLIMNSKIPVIVYVAPKGARAASAGVFIALSSHILAMAPGTNIGAAHPVSLMGGMDKSMEEKVVNDAAAYIRSIAEKRGKNVEWAEKAVRESVSITAKKALNLKIADIMAENREELLKKLQGRKVVIDGKEIKLTTEKVSIYFFEPDFKDRFLQHLADPNLAYILLMIGIWGIIFEFFNPGIFLPGIAGAICLVLSFFSLQLLPFNLVGLLLIILATILFILETQIISYGALTIGGVIALTLGSLMLIDPSAIYIHIGWEYIIAGVGTTLFLFVVVISYAIKAQFKKPTTGEEGLVGMVGVARTDLHPDGKVYVHGELWNAINIVPGEIIKKGEEVKVVKIEGMRLFVRKKEGG
ncbi:MAG TPA: nodulation protein NfeD [Candidatus Aerophobetes bacterium]|uniref:Nodulation protein NfeD n=1 Tax=Aerophobetes bacterium TaxID=2030807 RepID=A0A7V5HYD4_UNCAE|nr:nodulation protein NfeD [Candidatus Aerophobetes bacterium]